MWNYSRSFFRKVTGLCVCVCVCDVEVSQETRKTRNSTFMRIRGSGV